ncbi:PREDICTED: beta-1,4-N-acetylgalactosaminyltransferase bre-4-like [Papilio polytes]|uniref:beta-1,4-N-acetylgalactosaminyltransferase bre-4-like n=1 Tax=Papilio polytes TaxID=76194 RepID=UPI000675DE79|nr:PREDICTED: beta-1,4-N-acetylgalactosaminyltransferase bre-4-like [Papilio polytes]XP_013140944.1 PREDICTED: beta-1,4-N-acetylgalactosaminyltransferase bre-4-like [Papilio polytes]XP_013140945.1 PREDICTED: beta-1,4-N-acetylgalactosaminyltransferase bre-4-like [Papilio polytes]
MPNASMGTVSGSWRWSRVIRFLLLLVLALVAVEYLFGSILDVSVLRSILHPHNDSQTSFYPMKFDWTKQMTKTTEDRQPNKEVEHTTSKQTTDSKDLETIENDQKETTLYMATKTEEVIINKTTEKLNLNTTEPPLPLCEEIPPDLGPIPANKTEIELDYVETKYPEVDPGGQYAPPNCTARHRVAIIVPYRDREQHLAVFLNHMHPFLMKQQMEYGIFIVEQYGDKAFNRAKLMNVGFAESQKQKAGGWQCFIFHDIDLLPLDQRNLYSCPEQPRHMSALIDKFSFKLPYKDIFGGVSAMTVEQFTKVNGFSNKYWGWGGEDDDMFRRLNKMNYHLTRYEDLSIAKYAMLDHKPSVANPKRYQLLTQTSKTLESDGLSTLEYKLVEVTQHHLYTLVVANIDEPS